MNTTTVSGGGQQNLLHRRMRGARALLLSLLAVLVFIVPVAAEVSSGTSRDLDAYRTPYPSSSPQGYTLCDIVGIGIAGSNDHVYVWYRNGMVSSGTTSDLARYRSPQPYRLPQGRSPGDIVGIGIAGSNDRVYAWYRDGTISAGSSTDLAQYRAPRAYSLPSGKSPDSIVGIGIAGSNDRVYAWYADGTVSSGTSTDLDAAAPPQSVSNAQGFSSAQIVGIAIAGSNDHIYAWYADCAATGARPQFKMIQDVVIPSQAGQASSKPGTAAPPATLSPATLEALKRPDFKIIADAATPSTPQTPGENPDVKLSPGTTFTQLSTPQATAALNASAWQERLDDITQDGLAVLNDSMERLNAMTQKSATLRIEKAPDGLRQAALSGSNLAALMNRDQALAITKEIIGMVGLGMVQQNPDLSHVSVKPQLNDLFVFPEADALQPGGYVVFKGTGFGDTAGRVYMHYESGSGELYESRYTHDIELQPVNDSWAASWHDTAVVVRVPDDLPGVMLGGTREAQLALVKPDGGQVQLTVMLHASSAPVITAVTSSSGKIGCCCPIGTETWSMLPGSHSYVYWPAPGRLDTPHCGLDKKPWLQPGSDILITGKRFGEMQNGQLPGTLALEFSDESRPAGVTVKLEVTKWTATAIEAKVISSPIKGYFATHPAWINLHVGADYANAEPVAFGPEMTSKWVSGYKWLKLDWDKFGKKIETDNGEAMLVTHIPDCKVFGQGEKGYDEFFGDLAHAFPDDARVTWFRFEQIDPTHPVNEWDVFGLGVEDLASVILDPASLIQIGAELLVRAITLTGEGGYHAYPFFFGNEGMLMGPEHSFSIRWETSCKIGDGKPIVYTVSFLIEGPPSALSKY